MATRIAAGLELTLSQLLRLDEGGGVSVVRAAERLKGGAGRRGHAYEVVTPPLPGQRAEVAFHTLAAGRRDRRPGRPAAARARQPRDRARAEGALRLVCDGQAHDLRPATP